MVAASTLAAVSMPLWPMDMPAVATTAKRATAHRSASGDAQVERRCDPADVTHVG